MNDPNLVSSEVTVFVTAIVTLFLVVLAILWFLLPFAVFGTKDKLETLIREVRALNEQIVRLGDRLATSTDGLSSAGATVEQEYSRDELMAHYGISKEGDKYVFREHRYDVLADAVAYARKQLSR